MFPYPSGSGLHVGHPEGYTATDILARYKRMLGFNVLHPMGWDAFGLPAEQHAIETGTHPRETTQKNINTFRRQIKSLGFSYDWSREVDTTDPKYFKWTQWIFLVLYNTWFDAATNKGRPIAELPIPDAVKRRARRRRVSRSASPGLRTLFPSELVPRPRHRARQRRSDRWQIRTRQPSGSVLASPPMDDAYHRIRRPLASDLDTLDWSPALKEMQRNWIGQSEGAGNTSSS